MKQNLLRDTKTTSNGHAKAAALVSGLPQRSCVFDLRPLCVGLLVNKVALRHDPLLLLWSGCPIFLSVSFGLALSVLFHQYCRFTFCLTYSDAIIVSSQKLTE